MLYGKREYIILLYLLLKTFLSQLLVILSMGIYLRYNLNYYSVSGTKIDR